MFPHGKCDTDQSVREKGYRRRSGRCLWYQLAVKGNNMKTFVSDQHQKKAGKQVTAHPAGGCFWHGGETAACGSWGDDALPWSTERQQLNCLERRAGRSERRIKVFHVQQKLRQCSEGLDLCFYGCLSMKSADLYRKYNTRVCFHIHLCTKTSFGISWGASSPKCLDVFCEEIHLDYSCASGLYWG